MIDYNLLQYHYVLFYLISRSTNTTTSTSVHANTPLTNTSIVAGSVTSVLFVILLVVLGLVFWIKKKKNSMTFPNNISSICIPMNIKVKYMCMLYSHSQLYDSILKYHSRSSLDRFFFSWSNRIILYMLCSKWFRSFYPISIQ